MQVAGAAAFSPLLRRAHGASTSNGLEVKRVFVVFKCHLDIGFTDTQANVIRTYFDHFYPQALGTAAAVRAAGQDRYVWTTGSWLLYQYLEQASPADRKKMEGAIAAGDIAWHALPFSWQTELLDCTMIEGCLGFSQELDRRFGRKTVGAKMTDVPGHSRGIIRPLATAGIKLLDVGVNPASTCPEVPEAFLWKDPEGNSLIMLYHLHEYGGTVQVPNTDVAVAVNVRVDNTGPHTQAEIAQIYADLRKQFPNATVVASNMSEVAVALDAYRDRLPFVTGEIGDTWIYGVPSDPVKVARYRELARLRKEWIQQKTIATGDATDRLFLSRFALAPEHTWGTDTKRYIDHENYMPAALEKVLDQPGYLTMKRSWQEKLDNIDASVTSLPATLREQAESRLRSLRMPVPSPQGMQPHPVRRELDCRHFTLALDAKTGAIIKFGDKKTGREWASAQHPLALFVYQTLSKTDYDEFLAGYVLSKEWWAPQDFGKPGLEKLNAESRDVFPTLANCWSSREKDSTCLLAELRMEDSAGQNQGLRGWPATMFLQLQMPDAEAVVHVNFFCLNKAPNRMPESMWLTFAPEVVGAEGWSLDKVDQPVSPLDVIEGGARSMHAVTNHVRYQDSRGFLQLTTMDAPVIAVGARSPLNYSPNLPDMKQGIHVNLFNNAWGTNYIQWGGGDWTYRFSLSAG